MDTGTQHTNEKNITIKSNGNNETEEQNNWNKIFIK